MQKHLLNTLILALTVCLSFGCQADLGDVDTTSGLYVDMAMPIGAVTISMNDLLHSDDISNIYIDENGLFHIMDTTRMPYKPYHSIDLTQYLILNEGGQTFNVSDQLASLGFSGCLVGNGHTTITLEFPMSMHLHGFNGNPDDERIDSMTVNLADFTSFVNISNFNLDWSDISSIELVLGDRIRRSDGNTVVIPIQGKGFGQEIPISVDRFTLCLLENPAQQVSCASEVSSVDSIEMRIRFNICLPEGKTVTINPNSCFTYSLDINLITYQAIWGYLRESAELIDADHILMSELWKGWADEERMKLHFAEPALKMYIAHHIGAPLIAHIDYMYSVNQATGQRTYAEANGSCDWDIPFTNVLDPRNTGLQDSVVEELTFSSLPDQGRMDLLFANNPDSFCYAYHIHTDHERECEYPQHRITDNIGISSYAVLDLPFSFAENTELSNIQYIWNNRLTTLSLDSLLNQINIQSDFQTNDLTILTKIENSIPFDIDIVMECLDSTDNIVDIHFFDGDTLHVAAASTDDLSDRVTTPTNGQCYGHINRTDFARLAQVTHIRMKTYLSHNPKKARLTETNKIRLWFGISVNAEGTFKY
ncbi:MAG: hypothetical protein MJZ82_05465 [Paludibacteraceae bacterium]|nr:hypothetical protein [Paludibacteraceae bacterium]